MKKLAKHFSTFFRMKVARTAALLVTFSILAYTTSSAQSSNWGIGVQLGQPSGLSLKKHNPYGMSADILLAWDLNDFFFVNLHGTWEKNLSSNGDFHFVYGPGIFAGFRERSLNTEIDDDLFVGISGTFGLAYNIDRFEIYVRATPRLALIESSGGAVGGGLGFRFYFN